MGKLRKCRDCGRKVSSGAKACPYCGAKGPKWTVSERGALGCLILMAVGFVLLVVCKGC